MVKATIEDVAEEAGVSVATVDRVLNGRAAATLMGRYLSGRHGKVGLIAGSLSLRDHIERQFGFEQVMAHDFPNLTLLPVREGRDDRVKVHAVAEQLLADHTDLIGLYNVGAGSGGIAAALEQAGRARDVVFITHELTDDTRRALIDGTIDIIINQDAGHEVRSAIRVLMSKADRAPIVEQMERIRIDIYLRDNIP